MAGDFFVVVTASFRTLYVFVIMEPVTRREAVPSDHPYRFLILDRDSIFSTQLDRAVSDRGVRVLRTPVRAPKTNSVCERFGGTLRRECLDFLIPFSLGPGIPAAPQQPPPENGNRHRIPAGYVIRSTAVLGGLHREYSLGKVAA